MAEVTANTPASGHQNPSQEENQKLAMWLYLASEIVIFAVLIGVYVVFRFENPASVKAVHEELGIALVTINTFILLVSSYSLVMALRAIQNGNKQGFMQWMIGVIALGTAFLIGQYIEYAELAHLEITLGGISDQFGGFGMRFYAPTAFHGAHVLIGVIWAIRTLWVGMRGGYDDNPIGVEIFGLYWHFVDVVWIVLFTLIYLV
jgi:heme/copper-type cytochrome/quinol oxidase subunit 3